MPATELSRRAFVALTALSLRAADTPPTLALLTKLAARLSDNNITGAADAFSKDMPGYGDVIRNLDALTSQYDIICVIEINEESGDDTHRKAETEWFLQLRSKQENGPTERRNAKIHLETGRSGDSWKITSMEPRTLLSPPNIP